MLWRLAPVVPRGNDTAHSPYPSHPNAPAEFEQVGPGVRGREVVNFPALIREKGRAQYERMGNPAVPIPQAGPDRR
jgi:hypothetical protein